MDNYEVLNAHSVTAYLRNRPETKEFFPAGAELEAEEVGDGNLNLVFVVRSKNRQPSSILVKQALPYVRLVGTSWPLTPDRARFEGHSLDIYQELSPGLVPKLYLFDEAMKLNVMEHLDGYIILRKGLIVGTKYPRISEHMSTFLANTLFFTSDFAANPHAKKQRQGEFINPALCEITEDLVFTEPYEEGIERNRWNRRLDQQVKALRSNLVMKAEIAELKHSFMTAAEALIHGDLHTGSVMVYGDDARVIDSEFAFYGPMAFDLGTIIADFYLSYASHEVRTRDLEARADYQSWLLSTAEQIWEGFVNKFAKLMHEQANSPSWQNPVFQRRFLSKLLTDTAGFTCVNMMRRILGLARVEDLEGITDPDAQAYAMSLALNMAQRLLLGRHRLASIRDFSDIVKYARSSYPEPTFLDQR